jgi:Uma2 family endonuclease
MSEPAIRPTGWFRGLTLAGNRHLRHNSGIGGIRFFPSAVSWIMSTFFHAPSRREIDYPDSDGQPMAENTLQFEWIVTIKGGLESTFRNRPNVFVAGDLFWYPVEGRPEIRTAPDVMVVLGRPPGYRGSYKQWEEENIAPQVVFEILSPGNRTGEMLRKFRFYGKYGVDEYYLYDPDTGELWGWRRLLGELEEIPAMAGFVSPLLQVRFEPGDGPDHLKILDPQGVPFATYVELVEQREAERMRADEATRTAEQETKRADTERLRAERLAQRLRELGVEPE